MPSSEDDVPLSKRRKIPVKSDRVYEVVIVSDDDDSDNSIRAVGSSSRKSNLAAAKKSKGKSSKKASASRRRIGDLIEYNSDEDEDFTGDEPATSQPPRASSSRLNSSTRRSTNTSGAMAKLRREHHASQAELFHTSLPSTPNNRPASSPRKRISPSKHTINIAAPTKSAVSLRPNPLINTSSPTAPTLVSLCIKTFAANFETFVIPTVAGRAPEIRSTVKDMLEISPPHIKERIFDLLLIQDKGGWLSCRTINDLFFEPFAPTTIRLLGTSLPDLSMAKSFVHLPALSQNGQLITSLTLTMLIDMEDAAFASLISKMPNLRELNLRNNRHVGDKTAGKIGLLGTKLTSLNLGYTAVKLDAIAEIIKSCTSLEVLKIAGLTDVNDSSFKRLVATIWEAPKEPSPLQNLKNLKLRGLRMLSQNSLAQLLRRTPKLERLDISLTSVRNFLPLQHLITNMTKLHLSDCPVSWASLVTFLKSQKEPDVKNTLETLILGQGGPDVGINGESLGQIGKLLKGGILRKLSLARQNRIVFGGTRPFINFLEDVGRNCNYLDLSSIPLDEYLIEPLTGSESITHLVLNETALGDSSVPTIASLPNLKVLHIARSRFSRDGLFKILDRCKFLEEINLEGCRGIELSERKGFFEVWRNNPVEDRYTPTFSD